MGVNRIGKDHFGSSIEENSVILRCRFRYCTLRQIAAELAQSQDLPKKVAEAVLGDRVTSATQHLKNGDKIRLTGLGILQVRARPARMGRNPATVNLCRLRQAGKSRFVPRRN
jgi:DNA-binding protein HU-beta